MLYYIQTPPALDQYGMLDALQYRGDYRAQALERCKLKVMV